MKICDEGAVNLAAVIVKRAVQDWRNARRKLRKRPHSPNAAQYKSEIDECERFFRSAYFERITGINGAAFVRMLHEQEERA